MRNLLYKLEQCFAVLGLLFFSGAFGQALPALISPIRYLVWAGSIALIVLRWRSSLHTASRDIILWILSIIILLSFLWSHLPAFTIRDNREVLQMAAFGLYFATRYTVKEQVNLVAWTLGIGAIGSIIFALAVPSLGIHQLDHPGAWKGLYGYKNNLGSMMVLSAFTFFLLPVRYSQRFYKWAGFSLSIALMLLSTSKTSLVVSILIIAILLFYRNFRWEGKVTVFFLDIFILFVSGLVVFVLTNWVELLTTLGKDPTLTGRTPMWEVAFMRLMDKPLLGFGRGAFWAPGSHYAREAGRAVSNGFLPPHIHNGFIDLALDVGLIGFGLFIISFVIAYSRSLKQAYATDKTENVWYLGFLMFLFMNNMTESYLVFKSNIYWVLYMTTALSAMKTYPLFQNSIQKDSQVLASTS
jgi:exopolysaccharide production protein ExoQ